MKTTNYVNTFIGIAGDCPVDAGIVPPLKSGAPTIARMQFDMIWNHPYQYTSDDVIFTVHAIKNQVPKEELENERTKFFLKGQPCLRSSPLGKRYGWGVHNDENGKVAIYSAGSAGYETRKNDQTLAHVKAMRSKRK
ncbi:DUF6157 family protein [Hufsiella ginkgonis]|uniref:Uncharacterized protein n=1 Tax=Hufsiella ginkgonis TaxID=2695274 RepID=A0A7K1Y227_9SPHI|nr:DUF6157 family protein [Hufsiella ginkgonis]MXV17314.1 hypothetical protein [Hufsiella ginkgonis]